MNPIVPVPVSQGGFLFCRWGTAILVWTAFITRSLVPLWLAALIFLFSALLKIGRAPMIWLYRQTMDRIWSSGVVVLDERAMRFAHGLGTILTGACLVLGYAAPWPVARGAILALALAKTISALGFCPAARLYTCLQSGNCCRLSRGNRG
jgi:hypothetical protein